MINVSTEPQQVSPLLDYLYSKRAEIAKIAATASIAPSETKERKAFSKTQLLRQTLEYRKLLKTGLSKRQAAKQAGVSMQAMEGKLRTIKRMNEREAMHKEEDRMTDLVNHHRDSMTVLKALKKVGLTDCKYRASMARRGLENRKPNHIARKTNTK